MWHRAVCLSSEKETSVAGTAVTEWRILFFSVWVVLPSAAAELEQQQSLVSLQHSAILPAAAQAQQQQQ